MSSNTETPQTPPPAAAPDGAPAAANDPLNPVTDTLAALADLAQATGRFGVELAHTARAEIGVTLGALMRTLAWSLFAAFALACGVIALQVALVLGMIAWTGSAAWTFAIVALLDLLLFAIALRRRRQWRAHVGMSRTRAALHDFLHPAPAAPPPP